MRLVIQRVKKAKVEVDSEVCGEIAAGLLVFVGFGKGDLQPPLKKVAHKLANLRIFSDAEGRFNFSCLSSSKAILLVPQFTLYANSQKGHRPDFFNALEPKLAEQYFNNFVQEVECLLPAAVATGKFGANMQVHSINDGPVTIFLSDEDLDL